MPLTVKSVDDINRAIVDNLHKLDREAFDAVVGIPRSGLLPASLVALHLQLPLADLNAFCEGRVAGRSNAQNVERIRRILLVDDSCNKGGAMARALKMIKACKRWPKIEITRLAVFGPYQVERPEEICDVSLEFLKGPRAFEWNLWKHIRNERWAYDFDGVLCRDPTPEENDDGPRYRKFLETAEPLFLPQREIGVIITSRIEKYRPHTLDWLRRHGVKCKKLVMLNCASKAERMALMKADGGRGGWKARRLLEEDKELMIESSPKQASIIAKHSGRPVWCVATRRIYQATE